MNEDYTLPEHFQKDLLEAIEHLVELSIIRESLSVTHGYMCDTQGDVPELEEPLNEYESHVESKKEEIILLVEKKVSDILKEYAA